MSAISASAEGASDITVGIDTGVEITIKDSDADGFYEIGTADELYAFAYAVNGGNTSINVELTSNIVVNEGTMSAETDSESVRHWKPVGDFYHRYTGTFNGANYTISGLYFNDSDAYYVGLIGFLSTGGIVDYVGIINSYFNGYDKVGGVVGENDGDIVTNSYSTSIVNGYDCVGGVAGINYSKIDNCYNTGMVIGDKSVGGIAGMNNIGTITNSYNTGNIKCEGYDYDYEGDVGGIVGTNFSIVENTYNTGYVSGVSNVGGIVGWNQFATITNSNNTGVISGERYVGAIAGDSNGTITNSNNTGDISGERCTGGIAGDVSGIMENNYNTGYVSGESYTGGIAGWNDGTINNSYNTGDVSGTECNVGGIVGINRETITNNYSTGDVFGTEYVGSVIGEHIAGTITNNYYLEDSETDDFDGTIFKKKAQFNSGEVAYLLQKEQTEEIWSQNIGTEELPVLGGDKVYYYKNCKNEDVYSNTNGSNGCNYKNGFCIYCDSYEEPALNGDYYEIDNAGKLYWFADKVNSGETTINAELTADIVVNEGVMSAETDSTSVRHWTPIGNYSQNKVIYSGIFAGNDKTISGLYFNNTETNYVGLIGGLDANGLVDYIGVKNSYFNAGDYVGSVVGWSEGTIETICNTSEVNGYSFVGGVVGFNYKGTIKYNYNTGEVSGTVNYVGGVAGSNRGGTIETSYNTGKVSGAGDSVGGVAGLNSDGTIKTSYNTGEVSGTGDSVGGVVGLSTTGIIESNYNIGKVSGTGNYVGGVIAYNDNTTITNNYYLADKETDKIDETTFKTKAQFKSGEVAYLLQEV